MNEEEEEYMYREDNFIALSRLTYQSLCKMHDKPDLGALLQGS